MIKTNVCAYVLWYLFLKQASTWKGFHMKNVVCYTMCFLFFKLYATESIIEYTCTVITKPTLSQFFLRNITIIDKNNIGTSNLPSCTISCFYVLHTWGPLPS